MGEELNERIPEVLCLPQARELFDFWQNEEIPVYCYYELLEHLFLNLLTGETENDDLLIRILDFMEDMANSEDIEVQNLLAVQILEALFGLEYTVFTNMERKLLRPRTKELFQQTKQWFITPQPPKIE